jgi:hypothetical protein
VAIENMLARLTAQSNGPNPKEPSGGLPTFTAADISLIASSAPHMAWHALMAKYCDDLQSRLEIREYTHTISRMEWFSNPAYETIRVEARQLNKLADLVVMCWLNPRVPAGATLESRSAYVGMNHETYRRNFQPHYAHLAGELGFLQQVGERAVRRFLRRDDD